MSDCCSPKPSPGESHAHRTDDVHCESDPCDSTPDVAAKEFHPRPTTSSCCTPSLHKLQPTTQSQHKHQSSCCDSDHKHGSSLDYLLWVSFSICAIFYLAYWLTPTLLPEIVQHFAHSVFEMLNSIWWGILLGLVFVGLLAHVPQHLVLSVLGKGGTFNGILRATAAGVLLDLCSHGILMVGTKLYQKGASVGQVMAFLIASPWNSFSLTLINPNAG